MSSEPQSFSDLDALFLAAETPSQHLHVLATLVLDRSATPGADVFDLFQSRIRERYRMIQPLTRSPMRSFVGPPMWVEDPDDHLQRHLHHVLLKEGSGLDALAAMAGEIASHPLPRDRPLWEAWLVEGFDDDQWAVIAKIHHSAVDGVSGIFALAGFFDLEPSPPPSPIMPSPTEIEPPSAASVVSTTIRALRRKPAAVVSGLERVATSAVALVSPRSETAPLPGTGPRMRYNRALTPRRSVALSTLRLDEVKAVARGFGVSVNDVVVALCAGVLRRQALQSKDEPERPIVAAIPVSERRPEDGPVGNRLSFMFYALPIHLPSARERVAFVKRSAHDAKRVYAKAGQGLFSAFAAVVPKFAVGPAMKAMSSVRAANVMPPLVNVLISSIKGPELPLYVAGSRLASMFPMGPVIEGVGLGITAVSFSDEMAFGFIGCADLIEDIHELSLGLHLELAAMEDCLESRGP